MAATSNTAGRVFGFLGLLLQIGLLFAYGFSSSLLNEVRDAQTVNPAASNTSATFAGQFLVLYTMMALFALVGFGLLLSFLKYGTWSGMAIALMVIAINIQLGLMMQKFWYNVFINGFGVNENRAASVAAINTGFSNSTLSAQTDFHLHNQLIEIMPSVATIRLTLANTIGCLVAFTGVIGRVGLFESFWITIIFNIGFNLCYYVNIHLNFTRSVNPASFDDFGTNHIYVYASFFALILMIFLNCKPAKADNHTYVMNRISSILALMGTAFIFATFIFTGYLFPMTRNPISDNYAAMNIIFAMSASVIGTYIASAFFRRGNVGVREAMLGTISGGVMVGSMAGFMGNMAIAVSSGLFAGILSGFWYAVIHPRLNKSSVFDSHGVMGAFWLVSFIGGVVLAPGLIQSYINNGLAANIFGPTDFDFTDGNAASLQLAYTGVAGGTGLVLGLIAAIIAVAVRNVDDDFNDSSLFLRGDYGLLSHEKEEDAQMVAHDSAGNLKGETG